MSELNKVPVLDHGFVTLRNISGPTRRMDMETEPMEHDAPIELKGS